MNKKIIMAAVAGASAGIAIYLISKRMEEKRKKLLQKRGDKLRTMKPKKTYPYEYTL